ncbi:MAG TPA: hypothetical protein VN832_04010 [Stellaceae bacterium]|nr:hypothetical protein [Stellaceae bacterium]
MSQDDNEAAAPVRRSYLLRHWRGELSLPVAYWINGWLGDIPIILLATGAGLLIRVPALVKPALAAGMAVWVLAFLVSIWQLVGIWRSAGRHVGRGGRKIWAVLGQVSVGLGAVMLAAQLVTSAIPQMLELGRIWAGDAALAEHQIRVLPGGRDLFYSGAITYGVSEEVRRALDAAPGVTVIHLSSRGGRLVEAQHLHDLIAERGLATYVGQFCVSACTSAFMGGRERWLAPGARLGFHQASTPGGLSIATVLEVAAEKQALIRSGVSQAFAARAFDAPPSAMWYPSAPELLAARVVTGIAPPGQFASER